VTVFASLEVFLFVLAFFFSFSCGFFFLLFFPSLIDLSLSQFMSFSHFCPSDSLPHSTEESERGMGRVLAAGCGWRTTVM